MICTVTLNPAIDLFLEVPSIERDRVLRARSEHRRAGGKGLNVTRMLGILGKPSVALLAAGAGSGADLGELAAAEGLEVERIETGVPVRTNVHVGDEFDGTSIKVNMAGEEIPPMVLDRIAEWIVREAPRLTALVLAGSLPPGLPKDGWAALVRTGRDHGVPSFVDTSGQELAEAVSQVPDCVKVNLGELEELAGRRLPDVDAQVRALGELRTRGIGCACVTNGASGAVLADESGACSAAAPETVARRPVGAGDSFMAGLVRARLAGLRGGDALRQAIATGTAWAAREDAATINPGRVGELANRIGIVEVRPA